MGRQVVAAIKVNSHLVLMSPEDFDRVQRGEKASGAWVFYLDGDDGWTRLLVRGSGGAVGHALFDIPHFVMEQKMMRGIRARAQHGYRERVIGDLLARRAYADTERLPRKSRCPDDAGANMGV